MSYFIARNNKYKQKNLLKIFEHNQRRNLNYANKNINKDKMCDNYYLKQSSQNYLSEIKKIKEEYKIKGQLQKTSNIACELMVTSDNIFFDKMNREEQELFFKRTYDFIAKKIHGQENIIDAVVHMDEETPHMHLVYLPIIKNEKNENKLSCSTFWKGYNSYGDFQDNIYEYIRSYGYDLKRGIKGSLAKNLKIEQLKQITDFNKKLDIGIQLDKIENISNSIDLDLKENSGLKKNTYNKNEVDIIIKQLKMVNNEKNEIINKLVEVKTNLKHKDIINKCASLESKLEYNKDLYYDISKENRKLIKENKKLIKESNKYWDMFEYLLLKFKELISIVKTVIEKYVEPENQKEKNNIIDNFVDETNLKLQKIKNRDVENENGMKKSKDLDMEMDM